MPQAPIRVQLTFKDGRNIERIRVLNPRDPKDRKVILNTIVWASCNDRSISIQPLKVTAEASS